ncbi:MAG: PAS domain S-box protein [Chloroflexota bacterium]
MGRHVRQVVDKDAYKVVEPHVEAALTGRRVHYEAVVPFARIGTRSVMVDYVPDVDDQGEVKGFFALITDITNRRQAELALEQERDKAQTYLNIAGVIFIALNARGEVTLVNPRGCQILGYNQEEIVGKDWFANFLPESSRAEVRAIFSQLIAGEVGNFGQAEGPILTRDNEERLILWHNTLLTDDSGAIVGTLSSGQDITERKQAELALRESEERFQQFANNVDEVFFLLDALNGDLLYISPAYEKIWGSPMEHIHTFEDFLPRVHPDDRELLRLPEESGSFRPMVEYRIIRPDGELRWIRTHTYPIRDAQDQIVRLAGIVQDITAEREQRTLAEALANTAAVVNSTLDLSQVLREILDNVGLVVPHDAAEVWLIEEGTVRVVGSQGHAGRGSVEGLLAMRLPVDEIANMRMAEETGQPVLIGDTRELADWIELEATAWVRSLVTVPIQVGGEVLGFLNLLSDTPHHYTPAQGRHLQAFANQVATAIQNARLYQELERHSEALRQAVEARTAELRQSKERVEAILNHSPDPILLLKPGGAIETANPAFQRVFGYHVDELHRQPPLSLIAPDHAEVMQEALARAVESHQVERRELIARRKDDITFDAEVALAPIVEEGGTLLGVVCSVRDISILKEVARMKDAFVSNVSHELRTPITGLKLNHKLIELDPEKRAVYLERQGREIDRLNVLIEDLLRLSRLDQERVTLDIRQVDLNELVAQYVNDRTPLAESQGLTLSFEERADLPAIQADEGLIGQTLSALLTNAFNYTPAGGQVVVSTQSAEFDGQRWAGFSVGDTGPGISPADFPHLFERFYRGSAGYESGVPGTGLGLAIAGEIVEHHHGRIEVANRGEGEAGAVFTVWLPMAERES